VIGTLRICAGIRHVQGGYVVEMRFPYGGEMPYGEVICRTLEDVFELLERGDIDPIHRKEAAP
jgi:hypothetical protein